MSDGDHSTVNTDQCYVRDCASEHADMEAVENHIRQTDDHAHNVTSAFLPSDSDQ